MSAAVIPLHQVEPQLTPEQEEAGFALMANLDAASASNDEHAYLNAVGAFLDWQMSVGLLTREQWRRMVAPKLLDVLKRIDEIPEARSFLQRIRDEALEALNGEDYAERAAAALYITTLDAVQAPRLHNARRANEQRERAGWVERLRSMETRGELGCLLLWRHAWGDAVDERNTPRTEDIREAWTAARAAKRLSQEMLDKMGEPVRREGLHHTRRKPGGDA